MSYVMMVFFELDTGWPEDYDGNVNDFFSDNLKFWKPKGHAIYKWAVDNVVCKDARWVVFGPFNAPEKARIELEKISDYTGYRIIAEHCFKDMFGLPRKIYTDG